MAKTIIHLVRHAQVSAPSSKCRNACLVNHIPKGYHNLSVANQGLRDPRLTPLGEQQCAGLRASFPHHHRITHLVASPMRRTLYTCLLGFAADPPRPPRRPHAPVGSDDYHLAESDAAPAGVDAATLPGTGNGPKLGFAQPVIALPWVQEVSDLPCDVGSALSVLRAEFEETTVDLSQVPDDWTDKSSPGSHWRPEIEAIEARAKVARRWLRDLGRKWAEEQGNADRDAEIVVVTHGGFVHFLSGDWEGMEWGSGKTSNFRASWPV